MNRVCVFCGSSTGGDPAFARATRTFGRELAARDLELVYGGGGVGLMAELAEAIVDAGGSAIGVIPRDVFEREEPPGYLTDIHVVDSMAERKARMEAESDAFVALPGGFGTLEEIFEMVTAAQLGFVEAPSGLLNVDSYFDPLVEFLDSATHHGFIAETDRELLFVEDDPTRLLDELEARVRT